MLSRADAAQPPADRRLGINFKPTYRVCRKECLMVRKRRRKKLPVPGLHALVRRCDRECVRGSALDGHGILMRTRQRS